MIESDPFRQASYSNLWLARRAAGVPRYRLFCFCYAGGNANAYLPWQAEVDSSIEICAVQLPGRGTRLHERPYESMSALVEAIGTVIMKNAELPFAFFGHSLGALLAFEVARYCQRHYLRMPDHLFVSGCNAPRLRDSSRRLHAMSDAALVDELRKFNGTPPTILDNAELMALVLPTIRADFALAENYQYRFGPPLPIDMTVLLGKQDANIDPYSAEGWAGETLRSCRFEWFDGDHFFIYSARRAVLDCINRTLSGLRCA